MLDQAMHQQALEDVPRLALDTEMLHGEVEHGQRPPAALLRLGARQLGQQGQFGLGQGNRVGHGSPRSLV